MSNEPGARISQGIQAFEAKVADWPTWKKLAVFGPITIVILAALVTALDFIGIGFIHGHH